MSHWAEQIRNNLAEVNGRIAEAAACSGRACDQVRLTAVTKYVGREEAELLVHAGCRDLAESRPQKLWEMVGSWTGPPTTWHLIGHLQTNKVRRTLPLISLVHSVDSERLLATLDREATSTGRRISVLLEVNISGEEAKHGFAPEQVETVVGQSNQWPRVEIQGLMAMAGLGASPKGRREAARRQFEALRLLRDAVQRNAPPTAQLTELSMGMSGDYDLAVEEGATIVRVGSALFEGLR